MWIDSPPDWCTVNIAEQVKPGLRSSIVSWAIDKETSVRRQNRCLNTGNLAIESRLTDVQRGAESPQKGRKVSLF
jgi:hypothetical protein